MDTVLTVKEVAALTRLSRSQVYALAKAKKIHHIRMGKRIAVLKTEPEEWVKKQSVLAKL